MIGWLMTIVRMRVTGIRFFVEQRERGSEVSCVIAIVVGVGLSFTCKISTTQSPRDYIQSPRSSTFSVDMIKTYLTILYYTNTPNALSYLITLFSCLTICAEDAYYTNYYQYTSANSLTLFPRPFVQVLRLEQQPVGKVISITQLSQPFPKRERQSENQVSLANLHLQLR